jgi:hypothetical protein
MRQIKASACSGDVLKNGGVPKGVDIPSKPFALPDSIAIIEPTPAPTE